MLRFPSALARARTPAPVVLLEVAGTLASIMRLIFREPSDEMCLGARQRSFRAPISHCERDSIGIRIYGRDEQGAND